VFDGTWASKTRPTLQEPGLVGSAHPTKSESKRRSINHAMTREGSDQARQRWEQTIREGSNWGEAFRPDTSMRSQSFAFGANHPVDTIKTWWRDFKKELSLTIGSQNRRVRCTDLSDSWPKHGRSARRTPRNYRKRTRIHDKVVAQFLLKSNERRNSLPSGSFRNLPWHAGQRSKRNPLCCGVVKTSEDSDSSR